MDFSQNDVIITAKTIYGEARGEPRLGQIAVAWVVRNRAAQAAGRKQFGDGTAAGACLARWQFSSWNGNDPNSKILRTMPDDDPRLAPFVGIARLVLKGDAKDPTHGSTFYHASWLEKPKWAKGHAPVITIGRHLFYKGIS